MVLGQNVRSAYYNQVEETDSCLANLWQSSEEVAMANALGIQILTDKLNDIIS
jgi:hypothetical protein